MLLLGKIWSLTLCVHIWPEPSPFGFNGESGRHFVNGGIILLQLINGFAKQIQGTIHLRWRRKGDFGYPDPAFDAWVYKS